jgi:ESS family glutamate:Na+ symporter
VPAPAAGEDPGGRILLGGLVGLLLAMAIGSWLSKGLSALGLTLPAYIGAMLAAAAIRNLDDASGWLRLPHRLLDDLGNAALALFIAMALMTLRLWELAALALPLALILAAQVLFVALVSLWPTFRVMGRDYDAAVMASGFCGFMLGTTANAMANMGALSERYGPAPRAYLVVPMVGAFFIDFTNALVITAFLNFWR